MLAAAGAGWAMIGSVFTSWDNLIAQSPDIIFARCVATFDRLKPYPTMDYNGALSSDTSDVEVLFVLKGSTKPGFSHMASVYEPYRGEYFLAFAHYITYQTNAWYTASGENSIIPLTKSFRTNELAGKSLDEQIQYVLKQRLLDLREEIHRDTREKARVEAGLKPENMPAEATNNAPLSPSEGKTF